MSASTSHRFRASAFGRQRRRWDTPAMSAWVGARPAAVTTWLICLVLAVATVVLLTLGPSGLLPTESSDLFAGVAGGAFLAQALTFTTVGVLIVRRVPDNRIGWVFCATGLVGCVNLVTWQYADVNLHSSHHFPAVTAALVINSLIGEETAGWLAVSLLLFPDGRLPSRRWRPVLIGVVAGMGALVVASLLRPGSYDAPFEAVSNPFGIPGARGAMDALNVIGWVLVVTGIAAATASLLVRLRRARDLERQQVKLVLAVGALAAAVTAAVMTSWFVWSHGGLPVRMAVIGVAFAAFPLAAGFAILRRGLFGVDVVINRTLVYGAVTVLLALAFSGTVLLLGIVLGRGSRWTTAVATLVVALAFRPLRARMQDAVDRRFNRTRYHASARMTAFLQDLRADRVAPEDIEGLLRDLTSDPTLDLRFFLPDSK